MKNAIIYLYVIPYLQKHGLNDIGISPLNKKSY